MKVYLFDTETHIGYFPDNLTVRKRRVAVHAKTEFQAHKKATGHAYKAAGKWESVKRIVVNFMGYYETV